MKPDYSQNGIDLYCGDCLEILPHLQARVDAIVTDPPYATAGGGTSIAGRCTEDAFDVQFFRVWFSELLRNCEGCTTEESAIWMTIDWRGLIAVEQALVLSPKFRMAGVGVWNRGGLGMGFALRKTFENFALMVGQKWSRKKTDEPDVWNHEWFPSSRKFGHQAEKPVALMTRAIDLCGGELILDPFMGSGSTGIACVRTSRRFIGIEKDPRHFVTARDRIEREMQQGILV